MLLEDQLGFEFSLPFDVDEYYEQKYSILTHFKPLVILPQPSRVGVRPQHLCCCPFTRWLANRDPHERLDEGGSKESDGLFCSIGLYELLMVQELMPKISGVALSRAVRISTLVIFLNQSEDKIAVLLM